MVVYYISYGEPQRQPLWRPLLLILLITLALAMAAAIAYGIYELASDNGGGTSAPPGYAPGSLTYELTIRYESGANAIILADTSRSIMQGGYLNAVKVALEAVAIPYIEDADRAPENRQAALVPFTGVPEPPPELVSLETPEEASKWIRQARGLKTYDNPAYIYDTVAVAHEALKEHGDSKNDNIIVLLTDGSDGGLVEVDPTRLAPCPLEIPAEPGEVCSPVFEQIPVDPAKLVPCPAAVATAAGEVCNPVPGSADGGIITYETINPTDLKACPPELGGANVPCLDVVTHYETLDPVILEACPPKFAEPGNACMPVHSETDRDDLIVILANSEVPNLKVYIIGLGPGADQISLMLLARAGNGEYIHCSSVDDCKVLG